VSIRMSIAALCAGCALTLASSASAQTTLEISVYHNEQDNFGDTMRWWIDEIAARSDGRIIIEPVYNGALAKVTETLDAVRDGVVPMGIGLASFMSGAVPALGYAEMIGGLPASAEDASAAFVEIWPDVTAALEPQGVVPLWGQTAFGTGVICRDGFLESADDWQGQTVRAAGRWQSKQVEAMGASPVPIDTSEIYVALQNGTVNCALMNPTVTAALRLYEVAPYYTNLNLPSNIVTYMINQDTWNDLAEEDRAVIEEVSAEATARAVPYIMEKMDGQITAIEEGGGEVHDATPEAAKAFLDASKPIFEEIGAASGDVGRSFEEKLSAYW
jgi:TRAP-type transport system periplasmic protein